MTSGKWFFSRNAYIYVLIHVLGGPIKTVMVFYWGEREARKDANETFQIKAGDPEHSIVFALSHAPFPFWKVSNACCSALEKVFAYAASRGYEVEGISSDNAGNLKVFSFLLAYAQNQFGENTELDGLIFFALFSKL